MLSIPDYDGPTKLDKIGMYWAINAATLALKYEDRPFGCIIIDPDGSIINEATRYGTGSTRDPTGHSEIRSIRSACSRRMGHGLLQDHVLVSTHEPCSMCCGAINHAKISRVVWGSYRSDLPELFRSKLPAEILLGDTTHPPVIVPGVAREECIELFRSIVKWD